jgi:hypothetical protein
MFGSAAGTIGGFFPENRHARKDKGRRKNHLPQRNRFLRMLAGRFFPYMLRRISKEIQKDNNVTKFSKSVFLYCRAKSHAV